MSHDNTSGAGVNASVLLREGSEPTSLDDGREHASRHTDTCAGPAPLFTDWALVFDPDVAGEAIVAHLAADTSHDALCGVERPLAFTGGWYGTGSQDEYEFAAAAPLCATCARCAKPGGSK